jgi:hypothetical protein
MASSEESRYRRDQPNGDPKPDVIGSEGRKGSRGTRAAALALAATVAVGLASWKAISWHEGNVRRACAEAMRHPRQLGPFVLSADQAEELGKPGGVLGGVDRRLAHEIAVYNGKGISVVGVGLDGPAAAASAHAEKQKDVFNQGALALATTVAEAIESYDTQRGAGHISVQPSLGFYSFGPAELMPGMVGVSMPVLPPGCGQ